MDGEFEDLVGSRSDCIAVLHSGTSGSSGYFVGGSDLATVATFLGKKNRNEKWGSMPMSTHESMTSLWDLLIMQTIYGQHSPLVVRCSRMEIELVAFRFR